MGYRCGPTSLFPYGAQRCYLLPGHTHFSPIGTTTGEGGDHARPCLSSWHSQRVARWWEDHLCPIAYQALCIFWRCHSPAGKTPLSEPLGSLCLQRCSTLLDFSFLLHSVGFWEMVFPALESTWRLLPKAAFRQKKRKDQKFCNFPNFSWMHITSIKGSSQRSGSSVRCQYFFWPLSLHEIFSTSY